MIHERDFGESLANTLIGQWTREGQLFETTCIGGNWPTIDIYAETRSSANERIFCFFQVKSTKLGYLKKGTKKLKIQVPKSKLNELSLFQAPTYLIGVDYNEDNPPLSVCYIATIRGTFTKGMTSMATSHLLNEENLILLKEEVESLRMAVNRLKHKLTYVTNFENEDKDEVS